MVCVFKNSSRSSPKKRNSTTDNDEPLSGRKKAKLEDLSSPESFSNGGFDQFWNDGFLQAEEPSPDFCNWEFGEKPTKCIFCTAKEEEDEEEEEEEGGGKEEAESEKK